MPDGNLLPNEKSSNNFNADSEGFMAVEGALPPASLQSNNPENIANLYLIVLGLLGFFGILLKHATFFYLKKKNNRRLMQNA